MTLFWHGHFATSFEKVRNTYYLWRQNELFRRLATGNWLELLRETAKDPAMLIWLDQAQSRKEHPNENFARELMELFTLGEGHYTEKDVTEAARAFTGWSLDRLHERFIERPRWHDEGMKTVLGWSGQLDGEAVLAQIVAQPRSALFITGKIWDFFAGAPPEPALNVALADVFRRSGSQFKPLLRAMFLSQEFYGRELRRNQVKSPVQWLVGSARLLETELPPARISADLLRSLGQELFAPPNVKGWEGGMAWVTTNSLLARYNGAATLVQGYLPASGNRGSRQDPARTAPIEDRVGNRRIGSVAVARLFTERERADQEALLEAMERRLLQGSLKTQQRQALRDYLKGKGSLDEDAMRGALRLVMSTPEYQVT
jgi:uncharacterized protein (DUF1800 family)